MELANARVLLVVDDRAGHRSQSLGVAAALGFNNPEMLQLQPGNLPPWLKWLPPAWYYRNWPDVLEAAQRSDMLIAAGSAPSRALVVLKRQRPALFTVAILPIRRQRGVHDVISLPAHDAPRPAPNLMVTLGNVNAITPEKLALEGQRWAKRLAHLRGYKVAVFIGGPSRHGGLKTPGDAAQLITELAEALKAQYPQGAALLITTSRRTTPAQVAALEAALGASLAEAALPCYLWQPGNPTARDNPYLAYLHHCQAVVVTADSSSMVSEACSSGKPTYLWGGAGQTLDDVRPEKFRQLYSILAQQKRLKWWDGNLNLPPPSAPLQETLRLAGFIRGRWLRRFGVEG